MLYNIQFLRFVAAMLVVLYHSAARLPANDSIFRSLFSVGEAVGFAGVDIFFVISGFIMAYTTSDHSGGGSFSLDFAKRRLARIFSGYWPFFILAVVIFSYFRAEHFATSNLFKSFFLLPQSLNLVLLEVTWTLTYELYFYLLFSLLILLFKPQNRYRITLLAFICLLSLNLYQHFIAQSFSAEHIYLQPFWIQFLSSPFLLEFFAGVLAAWWLGKKPVGLALIWVLTGSILFLIGGLINEALYSGLIAQGFHVLPRVFIYGVPAVMILVGLVRMEKSGVGAGRRAAKAQGGEVSAAARFSSITGGASYAIYLSHILILTLAWNLGFNQLVAGWSGSMIIAAYVLLMLCILGFSVLHYSFIEKPLHKLFKRLLGL